MRDRYLAMLLFLVFNSAIAQNNMTIDSLNRVINASTGVEKLGPLIFLTRQYGAINENEKALEPAIEAMTIAYEFGDTVQIVTSSRMIGQLYNRLSQHNRAEDILLKTIPVARRHDLKNDLGIMLLNLAIVYVYQARYDRALEVNFQVLDYYKSDNRDISFPLNNIGVAYYKLKDYHKGQAYFTQSLLEKKKRNTTEDFDRVLINLSLSYAHTGNFSLAKILVDSALAICDNNCSTGILIEANYSLGVIHHSLKDLVKAENYFLTSCALARKLGHERFVLDNISSLLDIYITTNQIAKAEHYLPEVQALVEAGASSNLELVKIYSRYSQLYLARRDFKKAAQYQHRYINLRDSTYDEELTNNLMKVEAGYLERENLSRIESQNQILELKEQAIKGQQLLNILIGGIALILILLIGILISINRKKQLINHFLDEKVKERTKALEESQGNLIRLSKERKISIQRASQDISRSLTIVKGLCVLGLQDISDPDTRQYISKMNLTSEQLEFTLKNLLALGALHD